MKEANFAAGIGWSCDLTPENGSKCKESPPEQFVDSIAGLLANDTDFGVRSEEVYLKAYADGGDARAGIGEYLSFYNTQISHQNLGY